MIGHPSCDGVTIKIPYKVDILLHQSALHPPPFPTGLLRTESDFIVRSVETGLGNFTQSKSVRAGQRFFSSAFSFCKIKGY